MVVANKIGNKQNGTTKQCYQKDTKITNNGTMKRRYYETIAAMGIIFTNNRTMKQILWKNCTNRVKAVTNNSTTKQR